MSARRKSGFTLIELLVVIAIIAILAAILFPVFARARETARKSTCTNNIKECAMAVNIYMNDYDSTLPSSAINGGNSVGFCTGWGTAGLRLPPAAARTSWAQVIFDNIKSKDILFCPSDSAKDTYADGSTAGLSYWWKTALDDSWNGRNTFGAAPARKESECNYVSSQVVLYEHSGFHTGESVLSGGVQINVAYLDSHVRSVAIPTADASGFVNTTFPNTGPAITTTGEPMYFNYAEENINTTLVAGPLPKAANADPRKMSDKL